MKMGRANDRSRVGCRRDPIHMLANFRWIDRLIRFIQGRDLIHTLANRSNPAVGSIRYDGW